MTRAQSRLLVEALLLGVVGAISAQLFLWLLAGVQGVVLAGLRAAEGPGLGHGSWTARLAIPLATTLGGLVSGLLTYGLAPEAEGHGTDTVVAAFHQGGGMIRGRVAPVKMVASAVTIGSGGSAGREGPTALISAGVASTYAKWAGRSEEERQLLLLVGMAAGLSAIFRSPLGTAVFAIEVLYGAMDFEPEALLYTVLAAIVAYAVNGELVGWTPLFHVPAQMAVGTGGYLLFVVLGLSAGLVATVLPPVFYRVRDAFRALPVPPHIKPALGGLGVGIIAIGLPQVLGGGYEHIQAAIDGGMPPSLFLALLLGKIVALSLTVSSGGSGGVFAPTLFMGAMLGGFVADISGEPPAPYVVVGMAAVFGGAARVPVATLLMVLEMTGGYQLLVPATLAVMLAYLVQVSLTARLTYQSLYEAQVPRRADSPAHRVAHLRIALDLLRNRQVPDGIALGEFALEALLESGIPVDLAGGRRLVMETVEAESPSLGQPLRSVEQTRGDGAHVVGLLREDELLLPGAETALHAGDRLLIIRSSNAHAAGNASPPRGPPSGP
jgi:CIC family chloride channel protein